MNSRPGLLSSGRFNSNIRYFEIGVYNWREFPGIVFNSNIRYFEIGAGKTLSAVQYGLIVI